MVYVNALAVFATISILLLLPNASHALSSTNFGSTPNVVNSPQYRRHLTLPPRRCTTTVSCAIISARQSRHHQPLWAVAENTIATDETCSEAEDADTDIPIAMGTPPTVVAGPGARITSVSTNNSLTGNLSSSKWKNAVQSTVADMLKDQDAVIQQESVDVTQYSGSTTNSPPPPGTTSMGLLGEVVQEKLPAIPPRPGTFLVRTNGDNKTTTTKPQVSIRASIPHSTDDTHIANLRLSVFSRFDEEQQRIFRSRSIEVLNVRRRRGAVVLVGEVPTNKVGREHNRYLNEMQVRIANGHAYGEMNGGSAAVASKPSSPSLTVTSVRGAKITSVSSGVTVDSPSLTVIPLRGAKITSVSSGITVDSPSLTVTPIRGAKVTSVSPGIVVDNSDQPAFATIGTNHDGYTSSNNRRSSIIGSIECSHQEFRGTMLGNSRRKGSLMYVTEVAVRTDTRRCGAGAMLMKGVDKVASLRNVETIYLHVDVANRAACAMYEKCGYHYLDKREPIYAQFTASLNLHDGAMHGRKHYLLCKNRPGMITWLEEDDLFSETRKGAWDC